MLHSLFLSLALKELNKGGTRSYSIFSATSTLSFFVLLNIFSFLMIGELLIGEVFSQINDVLFAQGYFHFVTIISYFLVVAVIYFRFRNINLALQTNSRKSHLGKFAIYAVISGLVYVGILFLSI
ncbi:hypothetical protein CWC22_011055 [Pseudoalteromonas rubra]|uniref:Uncharacterized protein n=1 Tax=Pseudoalteromonas rubra TaxID=43658 RepID=A0A5S3V3T7_9GAMM|nr:hypothetical protein [Pseudoalteromonas rubra]QPB83496.1 hypothetical protein CWC22_011055 [Pseudoalteromonas rubra]